MCERFNALPFIYVKGNHYDVGFKIGCTFKNMIQDLVKNFSYLNDTLIPLYNTENGTRVYEDTLAVIDGSFPQYIEELRGMANGAEIPFYKLFLFHLDMILVENVANVSQMSDCNGCTSILCNHQGNLLLGHNEDALIGMMNHCYVVHAHITEPEPRGKWKIKEEKFTAVCYAGHLPGFCMSVNHHGLAYSINIIVPKAMYSGKTPRHFLSRALLSAQNLDDVVDILRDEGNGIGDAMSVNLGFLNKNELYNIEVGPNEKEKESVYSIITVGENQTYLHCNIFKHLPVPCQYENCFDSSRKREIVYEQLPQPKDMKSILSTLGNSSDQEFPIFRDGHPPDIAVTIQTGIFDFRNKVWYLYNENPRDAEEPLCKISLTCI